MLHLLPVLHLVLLHGLCHAIQLIVPILELVLQTLYFSLSVLQLLTALVDLTDQALYLSLSVLQLLTTLVKFTDQALIGFFLLCEQLGEFSLLNLFFLNLIEDRVHVLLHGDQLLL